MPTKLFNRSFLLAVLCLAFGQSSAQVGINTNTPMSMLDLNGNLSLKAIGIAPLFTGGTPGNARQIDDGVYISMTPTVGNVEFILPAAATYPGRVYILRNISNSVTAQIYTYGGQFFAKDSNTATPSPLNMPPNTTLKTVIVISDGSNWTYLF